MREENFLLKEAECDGFCYRSILICMVSVETIALWIGYSYVLELKYSSPFAYYVFESPFTNQNHLK